MPGLGSAEALATADQVHRLQDQPGWLEWSDEEVQWRLIEIHNTGRAIPRSRLDALFGKFELVGRIEHHSRGSGLSLPIAKAAVEQHGGPHPRPQRRGLGHRLLPAAAHARRRRPAARARPAYGTTSPRVSAAEPATKRSACRLTALRFEVELDHGGPGGAGGADEAGGGPDGAGGADHEEEITV